MALKRPITGKPRPAFCPLPKNRLPPLGSDDQSAILLPYLTPCLLSRKVATPPPLYFFLVCICTKRDVWLLGGGGIATGNQSPRALVGKHLVTRQASWVCSCQGPGSTRDKGAALLAKVLRGTLAPVGHLHEENRAHRQESALAQIIPLVRVAGPDPGDSIPRWRTLESGKLYQNGAGTSAGIVFPDQLCSIFLHFC